MGSGVNGTSLSNVEVLSVSHNNVSLITGQALSGLKALRQLKLDYNHIERLPASIFTDTHSLVVLSLAGNTNLDITSLGAALTPTTLPLLRRLDLSHIDSIATRGILPELVFSQLPALQQLVLRDVTIANMSADFFTALSRTSLRTLDLTGSSISEVNDTTIDPVAESLQQLVVDRAIVSARDLSAMFAGFVTHTNNTRLEVLSIKDVFVDGSHHAAVGQHLFRHLTNTR